LKEQLITINRFKFVVATIQTYEKILGLVLIDNTHNANILENLGSSKNKAILIKLKKVK